MMEDGKLSLDLLIGLSIFLFSFIFIASFLPGVFADVRNEIGLMHEAYRIGVILAEMDGFWRDQSGNGTNWHEKSDRWWDNNFYFFPGLSKGKADHLSYDKIRAFNNLTKQDYDLVRELLGLKTFDREYNFNVSLESLDSTSYSPFLVKDRNDSVVLQTGKPIPSTAYVARYERFVWIDPYYDLVGTFDIGTQESPRAEHPRCRETSRNDQNNERELECNFTYPVRLFGIYVEGKAGPAQVWWLGICFGNSSTQSSCNLPQYQDHQDQIALFYQGVFYNETLVERRYYDLTQEINSGLEGYFKRGDTVYLKMGIKNTNASLYLSDTVASIAGKAAAKIVIHVW